MAKIRIVVMREMWGLKKGESITADNYSEYIKYTCEKSKEQLDNMGINEYNVSEISNYAKDRWARGRYDEVMAEMVSIQKVGK